MIVNTIITKVPVELLVIHRPLSKSIVTYEVYVLIILLWSISIKY